MYGQNSTNKLKIIPIKNIYNENIIEESKNFDNPSESIPEEEKPNIM